MSTVHEKTLEMKRSVYHLLINGEQVEGATGETFKTYNPATGEVIAEVAKASKTLIVPFKPHGMRLITGSGRCGRSDAARKS